MRTLIYVPLAALVCGLLTAALAWVMRQLWLSESVMIAFPGAFVATWIWGVLIWDMAALTWDQLRSEE